MNRDFEVDEDLIQENIECSNWEEDDDTIICPYCGQQYEALYEETIIGDEYIDVYEEGEDECKCDACGHTFLLTKELTWTYRTEVMK